MREREIDVCSYKQAGTEIERERVVCNGTNVNLYYKMLPDGGASPLGESVACSDTV